MAHEVYVAVEQARDVVGVAVEIDPAVGRAAAETTPVDEEEPIRVGERALRLPRRLAATETAVHENGGVARPPGRDVQDGGALHAPSLTRPQAEAATSSSGSSGSKSDG